MVISQAIDLTGLKPIGPPEPDLTPAQMIDRAEALCDLLRARQAEAEANGNVSAETNGRIHFGFAPVGVS